MSFKIESLPAQGQDILCFLVTKEDTDKWPEFNLLLELCISYKPHYGGSIKKEGNTAKVSVFIGYY